MFFKTIMNMTNRIMQNMWSKSVNRLRSSDDIQIKGLVVGNVNVADINRVFEYNKIEVISKSEYNRSKDLRRCIRQGWLSVLGTNANHNPSKPQEVSSPPQQQQQQTSVNRTEILEIAKTMAKEMAKEMVKEMTDEISKIPKTVVFSGDSANAPVKSKINAIDIEEDTFIKMDKMTDVEVQKTVDLSKESTTKVVSSENIKASLSKIKQLKKKKMEG